MDKNYRTAEQFVYLHLRERILSGELSGGDRLSPVGIAAELGLSRMPVREALRLLDAEGLVTVQPNRRAVVTSLTNSEIEELFEMRAVLEALAVRFAMPHFTQANLIELERRNADMNTVQGDVKAWIERHGRFHDYIAEVSGRRHLKKQLGRIRNLIQPYLSLYAAAYSGTDKARYDHDVVIEAIRSRRSEAAEECMLEHVRATAQGVIDFLNREG